MPDIVNLSSLLTSTDTPALQYCKSCLYPSSKPNLLFEDGICSACRSYDNRSEVNWVDREAEFHKILHQYRRPGKYDCIVPASGGKDSFYQVWKLKSLGYNPLVVTASTDSLTPIGSQNLSAMRSLGVDHLEFTLNPKVRRIINRYQLINLGDISWPEHVAIWTIPVKVSVAYDIPLIIWGENGQNEYGGPASESTRNVLDRRWVEEFGGLNGFRVTDLLAYDDIHETDLISYSYPSDAEVHKVGSTGLYLGYYFEWDGWKNSFISESFGFKTYSTAVEGSLGSYENLDNHQTSIHDYFKYLKYGFGRATDLACNHIRRKRLSRQEGLQLVLHSDGRYPASYLGQSLEVTLREIGMTKPEFDEICDRFTNPDLFMKDSTGSFVRRPDGSPLLVSPPQ